MHVHGAQVHLDGDGAPHGLESAAATTGMFVVLSRCEGAGTECRLETHSAPHELYNRRFSPFEATRVLEQSLSPAWNELLLAQLPSAWREKTQQSSASYSQLGVKLELVQRGASQQEDYLLATAVLPLWTIACHQQQIRLALQFQLLTVFVSLRETSSSQESPCQRLEIVIQSFQIETSSESQPNSLALFLHSPSATGDGDRSAPLFTQAFQTVQHGYSFSTEQQEHSRLSALTPSASAPSEASTRFEWLFPFVFELTETQQTALVHGELSVTLFDTSASTHAVGQGRLQLSTEARATNGVATSFNAPIYNLSDSTRVLGHLQGSVRSWNQLAWQRFMANAAARRIVCTNRRDRKRDPLLALQWMGALARGLNRHPLSSFCDEGGISGILNLLLASPQEETKAAEALANATAANNATEQNGAAINTLLKDHISRLQQDLLEKRQQIERVRAAI